VWRHTDRDREPVAHREAHHSRRPHRGAAQHRAVRPDAELSGDVAAERLVVHAHHNYARFLPKAVDSLPGQTGGTPRIVVVDDGSPSRTRRQGSQADTGRSRERDSSTAVATSRLRLRPARAARLEDRLHLRANNFDVLRLVAGTLVLVSHCDPLTGRVEPFGEL